LPADLPLLATPNAWERHRKLEEKRAALLAEATRQRQVARDEQAVGDGIYWPIFNLDLKNPAAAETLAHAAPERLVADILAAERRIIELMEEIQSELSTSA
jgi:type I restriction enzyme M protein